MSTLAIVLIAIAVVVLILLVLGFLGARARDRQQAATWTRNVAEADAALEQARASDRGWDREAMSEAARAALAEAHPGSTFDELLLVLVDDRPGVEEDRAHFVGLRGNDEEARVVLARRGDRWVVETVD
jgi:type II secretory pathway pseudopilin PulG